MDESLIDGFFYGLFMDKAVLLAAGVRPTNFRRAYVDDFKMVIGDRATLVRCEGARSYGMVVSLSASDLNKLYAAPGLEGYFAEKVAVNLLEGGAVETVCYNLADPPKEDEKNHQYAQRLSAVLAKLAFPEQYIASIN